jgi:hypothetical protein
LLLLLLLPPLLLLLLEVCALDMLLHVPLLCPHGHSLPLGGNASQQGS